ncbi:MAG: Ig-like domain-containing protein [Patescibacteria group bacterium]
MALTAPTVTTQAGSSATPSSFVGNGKVTNWGSGGAFFVKGFCYKLGTSGDPTLENDSRIEHVDPPPINTGDYTETITGLIAGTSYRVRAYAYIISSDFTEFALGYGSTVTVTTRSSAVAPTVSTSAATEITDDSCKGNGSISDTGGELCSSRGFCYKIGASGDPTTSDTVASDTGSFNLGTFTKTITGLSPETNYRVRAFAVNSKGTSYGTTVNVLTDAAPLTLSLNDSITISDSIAKTARSTKADSISATDGISRVATFNRALTDTLTVTDGIAKSQSLSFADSVSIADNFSRVASFNLSFPEALYIADDINVSMPGQYVLNFNDSMTIIDSIGKSFSITLEDTLTVEDDMSRIVAYERLIADTITVSDDMTHSKIVLRTINIVANSMLKNATQQVSVIGVYSDESASDVTQFCSFATSDIDIATIDSGGLITSISEGLVTITATLGDLTTTYVLAVISESQSAALMTGIVSFANGDTYRTASYLSRRHVFKTNSISLVKVLASKYPVTIELVFPDIPLAIPVTVENKNPVRVKSFLMEAVEVRIAPAEEVTAVFLASTMEELTL